ncbi:akap7 2'5' RNA ligase-like domain, partial [Perkinsus olseni]
MSNKRVFTTVLKSQPLPPKAGDKASELPSESAPSSVDEPPAVKRKPSEVTEGFKTAEDISSGDDAEEKSAVSEVEELPDGGAPPGKTRGKKAGRPLLTHFLAIRVTNPKVLDYCGRVQDCVTEDAHEIMKEACVKREKVHLSMAVMRLESEERKQDAINAIKVATKELLDERQGGGIKLQPTELGSFPGVLHLKMDEDTSAVLRRYYELLSTEVKGRNIQMAKEKSSEFKPHATIIKAAQGMRRVKKFPELRKNKKEARTALKIPSIDDIKTKLGDDADLGDDTGENVEKVELCSMIEEKQEDGFFAVNYTLPLDKDIEVTDEMRETIAPPPPAEPEKEGKPAKAKKAAKDKKQKQKKDDVESEGGDPCRLEV